MEFLLPQENLISPKFPFQNALFLLIEGKYFTDFINKVLCSRYKQHYWYLTEILLPHPECIQWFYITHLCLCLRLLLTVMCHKTLTGPANATRSIVLGTIYIASAHKWKLISALWEKCQCNNLLTIRYPLGEYSSWDSVSCSDHLQCEKLVWLIKSKLDIQQGGKKKLYHLERKLANSGPDLALGYAVVCYQISSQLYSLIWPSSCCCIGITAPTAKAEVQTEIKIWPEVGTVCIVTSQLNTESNHTAHPNHGSLPLQNTIQNKHWAPWLKPVSFKDLWFTDWMGEQVGGISTHTHQNALAARAWAQILHHSPTFIPLS